MNDEELKKANRDRDRLWCRALIHVLDTKDIADVTDYFNQIRPDDTSDVLDTFILGKRRKLDE